MADIELGYGRTSVPFTYDESRFLILNPAASDHPLSDAEIGSAIDSPIESNPLDEVVQSGESVLIVVSDATRASASAQVVNLLVRRLIESGTAPHEITIIFATGIHRAVTPEETQELLTPFIARRIRTISHDAFDASQLTFRGKTSRGTAIELNRALFEYDRVIVTGAIGFHYFAGFTGGRKSICPGLASAATIEATHKLAFDADAGGRAAGVGAGLIDGNPVNLECEEIASTVAPAFLINAVTDGRGRATRIYAGNWLTAHRIGCAEFKERNSVPIDKRREIVIASCGGSPWDINLIQAHKALDMATNACSDGGDIVLIAECADGLGRANVLDWFEAADAQTLAKQLRDGYEVNGQTAWALLSKAERFRVHLVSELEPESVRRMRMIPSLSIEEALARTSKDAHGYIMPKAVDLLPFTAEI